MFLATTALDQYWKKDEKIFFLGDWCISDESIVKELDYDVLPNNWENFEMIKETEEYLYDIYLQIVPALANFLNSVHNKKYSDRYWEILVGPWLFNFVELSLMVRLEKWEICWSGSN